MAGGKKKADDPLWNMLVRELRMEEIRELQQYLDGDIDFHEMGYGDLTIEPYDSHGGASKLFRLRHNNYGELTIGRSALRSVLGELVHHLRAR